MLPRPCTVAEAIGVVAEPEIMSMEISPAHPFIVLASDGVWEFLPSQMVVDMVRCAWCRVCTEMAYLCVAREFLPQPDGGGHDAWLGLATSVI